MNSKNLIQYLYHDDIDEKKWDHRIGSSSNGLIYAYALYLNHMAIHWDALVLNDYEVIMPLPWNKKYGINYLYQPPFTAILGVFGNGLSQEILKSFLNAIPKKFRLVEISLNHENLIPSPSMQNRNNYVLSLNKKYGDLYNGYNENNRRNIRKALQHGCKIKKGIPISDVIKLSKSQMKKVTNVKQADYKNFEKLYQSLYKQDNAITYAVYSNDNELLASCAYLFSHNRAYYVLVGNHPIGKTQGASHYLIDRFIYDHAGQDLILDFEGSDIESVALYYSSFGATPEIYQFLKINNLPIWMAWLK
jgi:hypothetical protein